MTYVADIQVSKAILQTVDGAVAITVRLHSVRAIHTIDAVCVSVMHRRATEAAAATHEWWGYMVSWGRCRVGRNMRETTVIATEKRTGISPGPSNFWKKRTHSCNGQTGRMHTEACGCQTTGRAGSRCHVGGDRSRRHGARLAVAHHR